MSPIFSGILLLGLVGCPGDPPPVANPGSGTGSGSAPIANVTTRGCGDAAAGLEGATRDIRAPERSLLGPMRERCIDDRWSEAAIACFTDMKSGELGRCAKLLDDRQRDPLFAELGGTDRASVAIALAKLYDLKIGIAECDQFVATVALMLSCDAMPLATRIALGTETSDFWSLPTKNLPADAARRMAGVCKASLDTLTQEAATVGCM